MILRINKFLTSRENEIFQMLVQNKDTFEISQKLGISEKTVRNHISNVIQKLGVSSRTQAIVTLMKSGMIEM